MLSALLGLAPLPLAAQSIQRQMLVSALDSNGSPVSGLTASDFMVREDGVAREVLSATPAPEGRQIAVLIDTSEAAQTIIGDLRRGIEAFVNTMAGGNEIALISFGGTPRILTESTGNLTRLQEGIGSIFAFSGSASYLLDAVRETVEGFARRGAERPVVIVMTAQGIDYSSRDALEVVDRAQGSHAVVYSVVFGRPQIALLDPTSDTREIEERRRERERFLEIAPERTGGRRRDLLSSSAAETVMLEIANDLRNHYLIVYARPDMLIPPQQIEVTATRDDVDARGTPLGMER